MSKTSATTVHQKTQTWQPVTLIIFFAFPVAVAFRIFITTAIVVTITL
jgi:hypothetical protein